MGRIRAGVYGRNRELPTPTTTNTNRRQKYSKIMASSEPVYIPANPHTVATHAHRNGDHRQTALLTRSDVCCCCCGYCCCNLPSTMCVCHVPRRRRMVVTGYRTKGVVTSSPRDTLRNCEEVWQVELTHLFTFISAIT